MRIVLATAVIAALASMPAPAQVDLRTFAPRDYTAALRIDMAAIVDSGLWDLVERSAARILLGQFRDRFGFDLADLDQVRLMQRTDPPKAGAEPWERRHEQTWLLEGSPRIGAAGLSEEMQLEYPRVETVAGVEVRSAENGWHELASPAVGTLVLSSVADFDPDTGAYSTDLGGWIRTTLTGQRRGGTPVPDLLPLTAAPRALLVLAAVGSAGVPLGPETMQPLPPEWFEAGDLPRGVRLQVVQAPDTERFSVEVLVRFAAGGGPGQRTLADGFAAFRSGLAEETRWKPIARLLETVRTTTDRGDLTFSLDLGTEREMSARLLPLLLPLVAGWLVAGAMPQEGEILVEVEAAAAIEGEEEEPVAEPAPIPVKRRR